MNDNNPTAPVAAIKAAPTDAGGPAKIRKSNHATDKADAKDGKDKADAKAKEETAKPKPYAKAGFDFKPSEEFKKLIQEAEELKKRLAALSAAEDAQ